MPLPCAGLASAVSSHRKIVRLTRFTQPRQRGADAKGARVGTNIPASLLIIGGLALLNLFLCSGCVTDPKRFAVREVSPGIFTGKKPWTEAGFEALRAHGVKTILNLEELPWDVWPEAWQAHRNGLEYRNVAILPSVVPPSEKHVKKALTILNDPSLRPIYVHCFLSEDRSNFIIGLYRVCFQGWTPQAAWNEMLRSGYHPAIRLRGLTSFFWHHAAKPEWVKAARPPPPGKEVSSRQQSRVPAR